MTAETADTEGWLFADVIAVPRLDTELLSAVVCGANADFASLTTLLSAVCRELRPFLATSTLPRLLTEVLRLLAAVQ